MLFFRTNKLIEAGFQIFNAYPGRVRPLGMRVTEQALFWQLNTFQEQTEIDVEDIKGALILLIIGYTFALIAFFVERFSNVFYHRIFSENGRQLFKRRKILHLA